MPLDRQPPDLTSLFGVLAAHHVAFVVTGSTAALLNGVELAPGDLDITPALNAARYDQHGCGADEGAGPVTVDPPRIEAARSASACARDDDACAAATMRMIPESAVPSPTAATRIRRLPPATTVPATTFAPGFFYVALSAAAITFAF